MPISYVGSGSAGLVTGTTIIVPAPSGTQKSDLLVLAMMIRQTQITWPNYAGWTFVRADVEATHFSTAIYYRTVGSSEPPTYSFVIPATNQRTVAGIAAFRGASHSPPLVTAALPDSSTNLTVVAPSVNVPRARSMLVAIFSTEYQGDVITPPASMALAWLQASGPGLTNAGGTAAVAYQLLSATGPTGTRTATKLQARDDLGQTLVLGSAVHVSAASSASVSSSAAFKKKALISGSSSLSAVSSSLRSQRYRHQAASTSVDLQASNLPVSRYRPFKADARADLFETSFSFLWRLVSASAATSVESSLRLLKTRSISGSSSVSVDSENRILRVRRNTLAAQVSSVSEHPHVSRWRPIKAEVAHTFSQTSLSFTYRLISAEASCKASSAARAIRFRSTASSSAAAFSSSADRSFVRTARLGLSLLSTSSSSQSDLIATRLIAGSGVNYGPSAALAVLRTVIFGGASRLSASSVNDHRVTRRISTSVAVTAQVSSSVLRFQQPSSSSVIRVQSAASFRRHPASPVNIPSVGISPVTPRATVSSNRVPSSTPVLPVTKLGEREAPPSSDFVAPLEISDNYGGN